MSDFVENINGTNYTIDEAKRLFINYTLKHGGKITNRFYDSEVKVYQERLPNGSRALGNTNIENNSIVTFFHECKHLADSWRDSSGNWHSNWDNENDMTAQMSYVNYQQNPNLIKINRGTKGLAM